MGSRLRPSPEKIFECFLEVAAPTDSEGPETKFIHPTDFDEKGALKAIPQFCYPCVTSSEAVQHYTFVLTDIEGKYRFGFCRYSPDVKTCLCILSYLPWFKIFYELLNRISDLKRGNEVTAVLPILNHLYGQAPEEPGSSVSVAVDEGKRDFSFVVPDTTKLPSIPEDRNLTDYFAAVNPAIMIFIFASMFFERRIIVTSKKLNLLTACTYGASSLLYPMHWQHMFVPIVPRHLLDYCCAPMPFLVGVHASLMPKVRLMPLDEVVIFDADTDTIESPFDDVSQLPPGVVSTLKSTLKKPVYPIDDHVSRAFLCAMVSLIGGYRDALRLKPGEKIVFDRDAFVQSKSNSTRQLLEFILQLQIFEQFIAERLDMLNDGRGLNDAFEEQIGLQAENKGSWKSQYQSWLSETRKSGGAFLDKTGKMVMKQCMSKWKTAKSGIKSVGEKLKGKDEDEYAGDQKRSNTNPEFKAFSLHKLSPFNKRRTISPIEFEKLKIESGIKVRPPRPPPPRPNPYSASERRPRTSAMSTAEGKSSPKVAARSSAPHLSMEPVVAQLISLDDSPNSSNASGRTQGSTDSLEMGSLNTSSGDTSSFQGTPINEHSAGNITPSGTFSYEDLDINVRRSSSTRRISGSNEVSVERSKSSPSRPKPPVPERPASVKKKTQGSANPLLENVPTEDNITSTSSTTKPPKSVDDILESAQIDDTISPLRPVSLSLLQDTMASLPVDAQEFLFPETDVKSFEVDIGEKNGSNTNSSLETNRNEAEFQQSFSTSNHIGAVDLARFEIRRDSGPYNNVPKSNQALEANQNLNTNPQEIKSDNQSPICNSQQKPSWVSFD